MAKSRAANSVLKSARRSVQVNLYEAKTQLSTLVERAAKGEEIIIAKAGKPMARLGALGSDATWRAPREWARTCWGSHTLPRTSMRLYPRTSCETSGFDAG